MQSEANVGRRRGQDCKAKTGCCLNIRPASARGMNGVMSKAKPYPPGEILSSIEGVFIPAPDVESWIRATFIEQSGKLHHPEHQHLNMARLGVLWTNVPNIRNGKRYYGTAEVPNFTKGSKWQNERQEYQLRNWFGSVPDFLITLDALWFADVDDAEYCADIEHEVLHCGQQKRDGIPQFKKNGSPKFAMRAHDFEQFNLIVERYGARVAGVSEMVKAASKVPSVSATRIAGACGTCALRSA